MLAIAEHNILNVGFKGTPGRAGIAEGHKVGDKDYQPDLSYSKLLSLLGNDVQPIMQAYGRMPRGVIYTAMSGGVDFIADPEHVIDGVDYVCFTDAKGLSSRVWEFRPLAEMDESPVRRAKHPKILPHLYFPEYNWSLWVDANIRIRLPIEEFLVEHLSAGPFTAFKHPERSCLYVEAEVCIEKGKDSAEIIRNQVDRYRQEGFPPEQGMAECNVLLRRHNEAAVIAAMDLWWAEIHSGSKRDQLSFTYALWKTGQPLSLFRNGDVLLKNFKALQRTAHYVNTPAMGSRILYAAESGHVASRKVTASTMAVHSVRQAIPITWKILTALSVKVATHKGRATAPTVAFVYGIGFDGGIVPLGTSRLTDLETADNQYAVAQFDALSCVGFEFLLVEIVSNASEGGRPISFYYCYFDEMSLQPSPLSIDGHPVRGALCLAIQGF